MVYILAVFLCITVFCALYNGLTVRKYTVESGKIKNPIKIVLVSDVHSMKYGQNKLIKFIKKENPDMIVLAGDIFDAHKDEKYADMFLAKLPKNIYTVFTSGNHEHKTARWETFIRVIEKYKHINVLDNKKATFNINENFICVCAISDPSRKMNDESYDYKQIICEKFNCLGDGYNILLAHSPFYINDYKNGDFDLVLSGHTHGGQVRIPFVLNGLFNRSWGFFPPYCGGKYTHENGLIHVVCRGAANNPWWCPRVFNRREIVSIYLKNTKCKECD